MSEFLSTALGKWTGIMLAVLTGTFAQTMMKLGTRQVGRFGDTPFFPYLFKLLSSPFILLAVFSYCVGVILYMFMLSRLDLSFLYPAMTALGLSMATLISATILHEQVSFTRLVGIAVVIFGVFLISKSA